jgi:hypothetical protein
VGILGGGSGTITSTPAGISCGSDCDESIPYGTGNTTLELTATASPGSTFVKWSGDCSGASSTVTVMMNSRRTCTAIFTTP